MRKIGLGPTYSYTRRVFVEKWLEAKCRENHWKKSGLKPAAPRRTEALRLFWLSQINGDLAESIKRSAFDRLGESVLHVQARIITSKAWLLCIWCHWIQSSLLHASDRQDVEGVVLWLRIALLYRIITDGGDHTWQVPPPLSTSSSAHCTFLQISTGHL